MNVVVLLLFFAAATYATWTRGVGAAFALVYLPVLLLLSAVPDYELPLLPDLKSTFAVGYGVLAGLALRGGERMPFKWNLLDTLMTAIWLCSAVSAGETQGAELFRNTIGDGFFDWLTPYFMARVAFFSSDGRRWALGACVACAMLISLFALIEMRLWPNWVSEKLESVGLYTVPNSMALYRFGLNRARATFHQPMDEGACGAMLAALIAIFASTTSIGLKNIWVRIGIACSIIIALASLSFSAFASLLGVCGIVALMRYVPWTGRWLVVGVVAGICFFANFTNELLNTQLGERPEQLGQDIGDSMYTRTFIVQQCWPIAQQAGAWGYGKAIVSRDKLELDSVDNAYLLFIMQKGWVYFCMFLLIPFAAAFRVASAWRDAPAKSQRLPVSIAVAAILTVMAVMFTLFFGFVYSRMWLILIGLLNSACDLVQGRVRAEAPVQARMEQTPQISPALARGM